jgi:predicted nucleotidyltransferase
MTLSNRDKKIICRELELKGIYSIIIIGSRSRGEAKKDSDYDLYVVVSALFIPFIYWELKKKESILKNMLGSNVSLSPMTLKRINGGNDLLLLKTKLEGKTLSGLNYLPKIGINSIEEVPVDEIYSYLFSAAYLLLEHFSPAGSVDNKCVYNTAKAIIYCSEIQLMMKGILAINRAQIIKEIERFEIKENLEIIRISDSILGGENNETIDLFDFWFLARDYLINIFLKMNNKYLKLYHDLSVENQIEIIKNMECSLVKNFQFTILCISKKYPGSYYFIARKNIQKHFWYSLMCLVNSIGRDMSINNIYLGKSLESLTEIGLDFEKSSIDYLSNWCIIKNKIISYWPMANAKRFY